MLQAFSETSVITLLLTTKDESVYLLSMAYVIDKRLEGSIDGTPAGITQIKESIRRIDADSVATSLPAKIALRDLKMEDYFHSMQQISLSDPTGEKHSTVMVLMLKKQDDYTLGIYQTTGGVSTMLDGPISLPGTKPPVFRGSGDQKAFIRFIRVPNLDGSGGVDFFVSEGHVTKQAFSN